MEQFSDIISKIKEQKNANPPDDLVNIVMAKINKEEPRLISRFIRSMFKQRNLSADLQGLLSDKVVNKTQGAFIFFTVGIFYLIIGTILIMNLHNILNDANINWWLKIQPYLIVASAALIIASGVTVFLFNQKAIIAVQYAIILHAVFVAVNVVFLKSIIVIPAALVFALILTGAAIVLSILLISNIQHIRKYGLLTSECDYAQNIKIK